jgi:uncharacterized membrane protein YccC
MALSLLRHVKHPLRLAPVRPAISGGLRAAVATVVPLVLGQLLGLPEALWITLTGFSVALADKGGAHRQRAEAMAATTAIDVLAGILGALVGHWPGLSVLTIALWATLCSLARVWGARAANVGTSGIVVFVISVVLPVPLGPALARGGWLFVGGAWAMALALLLWPVHLYRPARRSVARALRQLAAYANFERPDSIDVGPEVLSAGGAVRTALEDAREVLVATRGGRRADDLRGERLTVLLESTDLLFAKVVALRDWRGEAGATGEEVRAVLANLALRCQALATALEDDRGGLVAPLEETPRVPPRPDTSSLAAPLEALLEDLELFLSAAEDVVHAATLSPKVLAQTSRERPPAPALTFLEGLTPDSVLLRHALRVGVTVAAGVAAAKYLRLAHGYWVTITIVVVLQPYVGPSYVKGLQRIGGTVLGGVVAAGLAALLHGGWAFSALVFVLAAATVAVLPVNYGLYAVLLTPTFVLITESAEGDWSLAWVRVVNTLIGGALALVGTFLLWPSPERQRVRAQLGQSLEAFAHLFQVAIQVPPDARAVDQARRAFGLAALNADESVQRLVVETPGDTALLAPPLVLLTYARRLTSTTLALAALPRPKDPALDAFLATLEVSLRELLASVREGTALSPLPPSLLGGIPKAAHRSVGPQLDRLVGQLAILHQAAARLALPT